MTRRLFACFLFLGSLAAQADITVEDAWARATVPGQEVSAVYMTLKSSVDATLMAASTPVAGSVEIHRMWMDRGVMKMRMVRTLTLPANKSVKLEPGGYHLMLFDLTKPLKAGETLELTLTVKDKGRKPYTQKISVPIQEPGAHPSPATH
ncbi:MAG: copper chaperone PCu(A)C [Methylophilaceae bacterium]|nr:copper chaperone PCu(A)C [Methylophilaceae bacterium]